MGNFPVLQRQDRKRPEMIQPISWQAEGVKGLMSGLQTGVEIGATIQKTQLLKAANKRAEALHVFKLQETRETVKNLSLTGNMLALKEQEANAMFSLKAIEDDMNLQAQKRKLEELETKLMSSMYDSTSDVSGLLMSADELNANISADVVSATGEYVDYLTKLPEGYAGNIKSLAARGSNPGMKYLASATHPIALREGLMNGRVPIIVTTSNQDIVTSFAMDEMDQDPNNPDASTNPPRPVNLKEVPRLRFGSVLAYAKEGIMVNDLAGLYASRDVDNKKVRKFLFFEKFSQARIDEIVGKIDELRGKKVDVLEGNGGGDEKVVLKALPVSITRTEGGVDISRPISISETGIDLFGSQALKEGTEIYSEVDKAKAWTQRFDILQKNAIPGGILIPDKYTSWVTRKILSLVPHIEKFVSDPAQIEAHTEKLQSAMEKLTKEQNDIAEQFKKNPSKELRQRSDALTVAVQFIQEDIANYRSAGFTRSPTTELGNDLQAAAQEKATVTMVKGGTVYEIPASEVAKAEGLGYTRR